MGASLGCTVWIGWPRLLFLSKEAENGCPVFMWLGVDGLSVRYAECGCSGCDGVGICALDFAVGIKFLRASFGRSS